MTAKEFFEEELSGEPLTQESVIEALREFAKLHVKAALKAATKTLPYDDKLNQDIFTLQSILNSYPDERIN